MTRAKTYCHLLWDSVYINQYGDVYACCHEQPGALGNIRQTDLSSIWSGSVLADFREQSTRNLLACAAPCNILTPDEKAGAGRVTVADYPKNVWLLWGEFCNIRCIMCPQDHHSRVALDPEVLKRHVDWRRIEDVEMQGGEVLTMKGAAAFYAWLTEDQGKRVNMITNGLLISREWADRLVRHARWVAVSVNAATKAVHEAVNLGSSFERVMEGVGRLVGVKRALGTGASVVYKFTIVGDNAHEIPQAVRVAHELGCDEIAFGYDRSVPSFLSSRPELASRLRAELAAVLRERRPLKIERKRLGHLGLWPEVELAAVVPRPGR